MTSNSLKNVETHKEILDDYVARDLLRRQGHPRHPLFVYNYTPKVQYENLWDEITLSCRGKIFDKDGFEITRPLRKFFNIEEKRYKPTEDWEVLDKVDGSFISLHKYQEQLILASRGSFTSDHVGWAKQVIAQIEKETGYIVLNNLREGWTYCLELVWPENRVVVDYGDKKDLVLLAIFDEKGIELPSETEQWLKDNGIRYDELYMRPKGSTNPDYEVKETMWKQILQNGWNIVAMFDDRQQIVDKGRQLGFTVCQVAYGDF